MAVLLTLAFGAWAADRPHFDQLEKALKLNPEQKAQFEVAVAATLRALLSVALDAMQLKERLQQQFSKTTPDLRALAKAQEALIERSRPLFRAAGDAWKRLFEMLDEDQVRVAKSRLDPLLRLSTQGFPIARIRPRIRRLQRIVRPPGSEGGRGIAIPNANHYHLLYDYFLELAMRRLVVALPLGVALGALAAGEPEFKLAIEKHVFAPERIEVPTGKKAKLMVENRDATPAEFESALLKIEKVIPGQSTATIFVGPLKSGEYPFADEYHPGSAKGVIVAK